MNPTKIGGFDIIGNLPEDLVAEVLSHLVDISDMRRLIHWQVVSKTWRRFLHSPNTRVYHQLLLHSFRLRALLPPPHYYGSGHSFFTYAIFRKALRTDLAIRKGEFKSAVPLVYSACVDDVKYERHGAVDLGPFFSDGFLVWLERRSNLITSGKTMLLRYLDFTNVTARSPAKLNPTSRQLIIAQFERPGQEERQLEGVFRRTSNHWVALGYGSGIVAYWTFMEKEITVMGLHESNRFRWKLPLSEILSPPDGGGLFIREIFCSEDYLVVSISRSATFQVFSMATRKRIHLINFSEENPERETTDFYYDTIASGNGEYAAGIGDNRYFIYATTKPFLINQVGRYSDPAELYFYSYDLDPNPSDQERASSFGDGRGYIGYVLLEPRFSIPIDPLASNTSISSADTPKPPIYDPPLTFLRPLARSSTKLCCQVPNRFPALKLKLNTQTRELLFYCHSHPPHVHHRFTYSNPPKSLDTAQEPWCDHSEYDPSRFTPRGFAPSVRLDDQQFAGLEIRYNTELVFADQSRNYRFTLSPVSFLRGGTSLRSSATSGGKERRCRLQMLQPTPPPATAKGARKVSVGGGAGAAEAKAHWDVGLGRKRAWRGLGAADRVWIEGGWEGVAALFNGRLVIWRWEDYVSEEEAVFAVAKTKKGKGERRWCWFPGRS